MSKPKKPYWDMSASELAEATREFDREHVADTFREMTPAEETAWRTAVEKPRRKRPIRGNAVETVSVKIQASLLKRVDALAKKRGISRARLVAESLEAILDKRGQ
jgi:hypothetical protein